MWFKVETKKKLRAKQFQISFFLRLLLKKVAVIPKSQLPKLTEALRNVPTETEYVSSLLPRQADSNGFKLIVKLENRGYVYFEPVQSRFIVIMLESLKDNNELYRDVTIEPNNMPENLLGACEQSSREQGILTKIL